MAKFILIKRTAFKQLEKQHGLHPFRTNSNVRRPYMGIQADEERFSTIVVVTKDGQKLDLLDLHSLSATGRTKNYSNFIVQSVQRVSQEKFQIQETWGEEWLLTYGKKPVVLQVSGILVSAKNFPWEAEFWFNYENVLRSTRLAELGARIFMEVDRMYYSGYMVGAQATKQFEVQNQVPFSFHLFATNIGYFDSAMEDGSTLNIPSTSDAPINVRPNLKPKTNLGEYAQLQPEDATSFGTRREPRLWKETRNNVFDDLVPDMHESPHTASKVYGSWEGTELPDSYAEELEAGFSEGDTIFGKGADARKANGTYTPPFARTRAGRSEFTEALDFLSDTTTTFQQTDLRQMVGTLKENAENRLGRFLQNGESLLNSINPYERLKSRTARNLQTLQEAGPAFINGVANILNNNPVVGGFGVKRHVRNVLTIQNLTSAQDVLNRSRPDGSPPPRFPRPGTFLLT